MLEIIMFALCVSALGLVIEKTIHPEENLEMLVMYLKKDIGHFFKALFGKTKSRHQFDITMSSDIQTVLKRFVRLGFEVQMKNEMFRKIPTILIRFVPAREFEPEEVEEMLKILLIRFREYMEFYGVTWKCFGTYSISCDYVYINIHYCEFECDRLAFIDLYRQKVRHKTRKNSVLRDEELEAELKDVDKTRV